MYGKKKKKRKKSQYLKGAFIDEILDFNFLYRSGNFYLHVY